MNYEIPCDSCKNVFEITNAQAGSLLTCLCGNQQTMPSFGRLQQLSPEKEDRETKPAKYDVLALSVITIWLCAMLPLTLSLCFQVDMETRFYGWLTVSLSMILAARAWIFLLIFRELRALGFLQLIPYAGAIFTLIFGVKRWDVAWLPMLMLLVGAISSVLIFWLGSVPVETPPSLEFDPSDFGETSSTY